MLRRPRCIHSDDICATVGLIQSSLFTHYIEAEWYRMFSYICMGALNMEKGIQTIYFFCVAVIICFPQDVRKVSGDLCLPEIMRYSLYKAEIIAGTNAFSGAMSQEQERIYHSICCSQIKNYFEMT